MSLSWVGEEIETVALPRLSTTDHAPCLGDSRKTNEPVHASFDLSVRFRTALVPTPPGRPRAGLGLFQPTQPDGPLWPRKWLPLQCQEFELRHGLAKAGEPFRPKTRSCVLQRLQSGSVRQAWLLRSGSRSRRRARTISGKAPPSPKMGLAS